MRSVIHAIDFASEWFGRTVRWLCVALILIITYEVGMRYIFNAASVWAFETSEMLGCTIYVFGLSYCLKHNAHIRIDILFAHLPARGQAIIDFLGDLLIFFPLIIVLSLEATSWAMDSWRTGEVMVHGAWFPPAAPWRTVLAAGFVLLALQGAAHFVRHTYLLVRNRPYD